MLFALAILAPLVGANNAQPASRFDLSAAIVEHGTVNIDGYPRGVDYSVYHGIRSDKAPGQAILATPFYAVARLVGAESASHTRHDGNLTLWWVTLWSATIPFAALLVVMRRTIARVAPGAALPATLAVGFGTLLLPYSVNLYGHVLAALAAFGAWSVLSKAPDVRARAIVAGLLAGIAVFVEYEAILIVATLFVFVAIRNRRAIGWYVLGVLPGALALMSYEWIAFGAPWKLPYETYEADVPHKSVTGMQMPFGVAARLLFSPSRGLLLVSPVILLAVACAIWLARRDERPAIRTHARVGLVVCGLYLLAVALARATNVQEIPGPRFLIVAIPFVAVPLAASWERIRVVAILAATWGAIVMGLATITSLLVGDGEPLFHAYRARLRAHDFLPTLWSLGFGSAGAVLWFVIIAAAVAFLVRAGRATGDAKVALSTAAPS